MASELACYHYGCFSKDYSGPKTARYHSDKVDKRCFSLTSPSNTPYGTHAHMVALALFPFQVQ